MGSDATVDIWYGISCSHGDNEDIEDIKEMLPRDVLDNDGELLWREDDIERMFSKYGFEPKEFCISDEAAGIGAKIFSHYWSEPVEFDLDEIKKKVDVVKDSVKKFFKDCGIDESRVKLWCECDYF